MAGETNGPGGHGAVPARDDARARLLAAAARIYATHGFLGATTRAIAAEAGVNEVTLFRVFGSKEALLDEAIAATAEAVPVAPLPAEPRDPARELTAWCRAELARLREGRDLIRQCFAESAERPQHVRRATESIEAAADALRAYVTRLKRAGLAEATPRQRDTAVTMLLATLIADALGRDEMGGVFAASPADAPRRYATLFLGAIGAVPEE